MTSAGRIRRVVSAAIRFTYLDAAGQRKELGVTGVRHFDALMVAQIEAAGISTRDPLEAAIHQRDKGIQGFVDNCYNFLSRAEAYELALEAGQILNGPKTGLLKLFSEDLY